MDSEQILHRYTWSQGVCFRHPANGKGQTAAVKIVHPRHGGREEVRACRECVLDMESERQEAANRAEIPYEPGHAGQGLA